MPKRDKRTASAKYAARADPNGSYATCVEGIVKACEQKICLLEKEKLAKATYSTAELKQAADDWAKTVLTPESVGRIATKARTSVRDKLQHLKLQLAEISLGETIHWPLTLSSDKFTSTQTSFTKTSLRWSPRP
ncbi:hypothetical protein RHOSPDRAFT_27733 [Rhodotorula sp. JG-1b]|nr:hypothetical protein RHOSPDRAFT_27733 [Rhodotorula sp. JG-1b]